MGSHFGPFDMLFADPLRATFDQRAFSYTLRRCEHRLRFTTCAVARLNAVCRFLSDRFVLDVHTEAHLDVSDVPVGGPSAPPIAHSDKLTRAVLDICYTTLFFYLKLAFFHRFDR